MSEHLCSTLTYFQPNVGLVKCIDVCPPFKTLRKQLHFCSQNCKGMNNDAWGIISKFNTKFKPLYATACFHYIEPMLYLGSKFKIYIKTSECILNSYREFFFVSEYITHNCANLTRYTTHQTSTPFFQNNFNSTSDSTSADFVTNPLSFKEHYDILRNAIIAVASYF